MAHTPKPSTRAYSTAGQSNSQEPPWLDACPWRSTLCCQRRDQRVFTSFPEQTPMVVETLVRDKKGLRTGQENLKSYTLLLPSDLTSKLEITITAGGSSRISLHFQFWKTKTVSLRGVEEPNYFLSSVSVALKFRELPVFCANIAYSQS